jgi:hypothetical protein
MSTLVGRGKDGVVRFKNEISMNYFWNCLERIMQLNSKKLPIYINFSFVS